MNINIADSVAQQIRRTQAAGRWKKVFNATKALNRMSLLTGGGRGAGLFGAMKQKGMIGQRATLGNSKVSETTANIKESSVSSGKNDDLKKSK